MEPVTIDGFLAKLADVILNPLIRLMFAAAVIYFLWGVFTYIRNADSESERQKGAQHILWGVIGMGIMIGVYGILSLFTSAILS